jgi:uncharacterized protein (TIGR00369 family)
LPEFIKPSYFMPFSNRFIQLKQQVAALPADAQNETINAIMQKLVPIFGTVGLVILDWAFEYCEISLPNRPAIQNGWGSIQAGGIYTTAESAMALVVAANLSDNQLVVAKSVTIDYLRKCRGSISAQTTLTADQISYIRNTDKGELTLQAEVYDETNERTAVCTATWVWHPIRN